VTGAKGREKTAQKSDAARMATRVMIPASPDGLKPRAPPFELLDADGLGVDPVDEGDPPEDEEELAPVALALKASNVLSTVGFTAKTIPA